MGHIYVSYSRRDQEVVDRIIGAMEQGGLSVWIDREDIKVDKASKTWRAQIVEAIDTCDAFVLMLSPNLVASENVSKEVDLADSEGKGLVPVLLAPTKLPAKLRYRLAGLQFIDLPNLGFDKAVNQLIEILREQPKASQEQAVREVELVIKGLDLSALTSEKQDNLLDLISELTETPRSQFQMVNLTPAYASIGMPAQAAFGLKALALNLDDRLKQFGINALRLEGNKKYVDLSIKSNRPPGDPTTDAPPPKPKPR